MRRTVLSLTGGLTAALLLVSAPVAQAAVGAKDAPAKGDIVKAFPEIADGEFSTDKTKKISVPGKSCEVPATTKVKSAVSTTGVSATGVPIVQASVAEAKSAAKAKAYLAAYKKYAKSCATFTEPTTGAVITTSLGKSLKLGDGSLTVTQETSISGITTYSTSVLTRDGKRVSSVVAIDDAAVSSSAIKTLAKVAAKKMK